MKKRSKTLVIKILIVSLAIINLVALFVFDYKVPDFLKFSDKAADTPVASPNVSEAQTYSIKFETDTLTYDGTSELDLMKGVSVTDSAGNAADLEVFVNIVTAESLNDKEIVYSINAGDEQIQATRKLKLENYNGPKLVLPETLPEVEEETLDTIVSLMPNDGTFYAKDGYGKDLTAQISATYTIDPNDPKVVHYVFSVTNMFNDKVSVPADVTIASSRPILVLKQNAVTITKGASFQPLDYIERAESQLGADLIHTIEVSGSVDVNTPGKYALTFVITSDEGIQSHPQKLEVIVE